VISNNKVVLRVLTETGAECVDAACAICPYKSVRELTFYSYWAYLHAYPHVETCRHQIPAVGNAEGDYDAV
jgi:hypothetical protein